MTRKVTGGARRISSQEYSTRPTLSTNGETFSQRKITDIVSQDLMNSLDRKVSGNDLHDLVHVVMEADRFIQIAKSILDKVVIYGS